MVISSGSFYGQPFRTDRGVVQGYPVSLTVFKVVVDALIRMVMLEVCGPKEA